MTVLITCTCMHTRLLPSLHTHTRTHIHTHSLSPLSLSLTHTHTRTHTHTLATSLSPALFKPQSAWCDVINAALICASLLSTLYSICDFFDAFLKGEGLSPVELIKDFFANISHTSGGTLAFSLTSTAVLLTLHFLRAYRPSNLVRTPCFMSCLCRGFVYCQTVRSGRFLHVFLILFFATKPNMTCRFCDSSRAF